MSLGVGPLLSEPKGVWVWVRVRVLPCPIPKGLGWVQSPYPRGLGSAAGPKMNLGMVPSIIEPKRVGVWLCGRTQGGLGLGPFVSGPNGVGVRVLPCPDPNGCGMSLESDPRGLSLGSMSGPKMGFGVGPSLPGPKRVGGWIRGRTQWGWGLGPSVAKPKSVWVGFGVCVRTQNIWIWTPDPTERGPYQQTRWPGWAAGFACLAQRQGMTTQVLGVCSLGRNPSPCSLGTFMARNDYPCARCLCLGLQHTMPLQNVQSTVQ